MNSRKPYSLALRSSDTIKKRLLEMEALYEDHYIAGII